MPLAWRGSTELQKFCSSTMIPSLLSDGGRMSKSFLFNENVMAAKARTYGIIPTSEAS